MKAIRIWFIALVLGLAQTAALRAQEVGVKTNLLYDATTTPNIGIEVALGRKTTAQLFYGLNPWKFSSTEQLRHWLLMPELRWWTCQKFNGHFWGIHALGGEFNMSGVKLPFGAWPELENHRYEGWYAGGGLTYGYQWLLAKHWNLEASLGLGYVHVHYNKYDCATCGEHKKEGNKNYVGPTKAAVSLIYLF